MAFYRPSFVDNLVTFSLYFIGSMEGETFLIRHMKSSAIHSSLIVSIYKVYIKRWNLLVNIVERFVANFTPDGQIDVVAIGQSAVEIVDQTGSSSATCAHSTSAMVEVALGSLRNKMSG